MSSSDEVSSTTVEKEFNRIAAICKPVSTAMFVLAVFVTGLLALFTILLLMGLFVLGITISATGDMLAVLTLPVLYCCSIALTWTLWGITRGIAKHEGPFTTTTRRGMAALSALYALAAILDFIPLDPASLAIKVASITTTFDYGAHDTGTLSIGTIGAAVMFAVLTVVFKYGSLLQRVSDDTV